MFSTAGVSSGSNPYRSYTSAMTLITYCRRRTSSGKKSRIPRAGPVFIATVGHSRCTRLVSSALCTSHCPYRSARNSAR